MTTLKDQLATDLAGVFEHDFRDTVRIGRKNYSGLIEDVTEAEDSEPGGPYVLADTRFHIKRADLSAVAIQTEVEDVNTDINYRVLSTVKSPDGALLTLNLKRI